MINQSRDGRKWVEGTYVELRFNFVHCLLLLLDDVLSYDFGEPPCIFRRHCRKHVEGFGLRVC